MNPERAFKPVWHEGTVDMDRAHILLTYGEGDPDNDLPVALIALGARLTITVQFLITAEGDEHASNILAEVREELDTYLAGEYPLEVWDDAKYRCALSPKPDSKIHWRYRLDWEKDRHASARWN